MTQPRPVGSFRLASGGALVAVDAATVERLLDVLPNPVFVKDEHHRWTVLNDAFCAFMGRARDELIGKSDFDFFPADEARVFWAKDDEVFAGGGLNENEEQFTDAAGKRHVILTRKALHVDPQGRRFLLGVITDITALRDATALLRQSRDALEERVEQRTAELRASNALLREQEANRTAFLAVLSHELRNPLAPIANGIYLLERAPPDSDAAVHARSVIRRQTEHLTRLIDDLLDVTRISRGKVELRRARIDLRDVVQRTTDDLRSLFDQSGLALRVECSGPVWVDADPTRVAQVIGNLLHNAVKFTPPGGTVGVELSSDASHAELRVRDDGVGMEPDDVQRMFEPFQQADHGLARTKGGLGLGLALVRGLVELHGGSVTARSAGLGRGSEFVIRLPSVAPPGVAPEPRHAPRATGGRLVVIVEDNVDSGETLAEVLRLAGHDARHVTTGRAGLALVAEAQPDVLVCDIGLPDLDGYEVVRTLRATPAGARLYAIALTGYAQAEDREQAIAAGFDEHLPKPPAIDALAQLIERSRRR